MVSSAGRVGIAGGTKDFRRAFSGNSYPHKIRCVSCQADKFNISFKGAIVAEHPVGQ